MNISFIFKLLSCVSQLIVPCMGLFHVSVHFLLPLINLEFQIQKILLIWHISKKIFTLFLSYLNNIPPVNIVDGTSSTICEKKSYLCYLFFVTKRYFICSKFSVSLLSISKLTTPKLLLCYILLFTLCVSGLARVVNMMASITWIMVHSNSSLASISLLILHYNGTIGWDIFLCKIASSTAYRVLCYYFKIVSQLRKHHCASYASRIDNNSSLFKLIHSNVQRLCNEDITPVSSCFDALVYF